MYEAVKVARAREEWKDEKRRRRSYTSQMCCSWRARYNYTWQSCEFVVKIE